MRTKREIVYWQGSYWPPRIAVSIFVIFVYFLVLPEVLTLLQGNSFANSFLIAAFVSSLVIWCWQRRSWLNGFVFIGIGLIYMATMLNKLLFTSVVTTSICLTLIGVLFLMDGTILTVKESPSRRRTLGKR